MVGMVISILTACGSGGTPQAAPPAATAPAISSQPSSQTVNSGQTATFSVVASGTSPLSYQWKKSGTAIPGATSASYTTPATTSADNGSQFEVSVSNSAGSVTSAAAMLSVNSAPSIMTQPSSQTVSVGQEATFAVVASGTAPLSYQWQKAGANIAGATSASYATAAVALSDNSSQFQVVVSNMAGSITSAAATLSVTSSPSISTQPSSQTVTAGQTATFTVVAFGTAPLSYQWQKGGANISGATSASYTTPATVSSDNGSQFQVTVSNASGSVTSSAATLTVNSPPSITTQPANETVTAGQTATFSVAAAGTAPLSYQWQKGGANISGATSASYTTPATSLSDNASQFQVVVSNVAGNVTSTAATLTVNSQPAITTQPVNQTVVAGESATFTVAATGTAPLSYQWKKGGANIAGANSASYATPATALSDNGSQFDVVVSNSFGSITSNTVTLTVTAMATVDVTTYQYDNTRAGVNQQETTLTPANVNSAMFGKIGFFPVDGLVDGQPLYLSQVTIANKGTHNVVYTVTENDSVYAYEADHGNILWQVSLLGTGETPSDDRGCTQVTPEIGITSTPVIDRGLGPNGAIYTVAMSKDSSGNYIQRVHALDITTGAELFGGPVVVEATFPGTGANSNNGNVIFDPAQYKERAGLTLSNGVLYTTWASHCDAYPYTGWIIGYDASTLAQTQVLNITPNGNLGAIWMAGAAPAVDSDGYIYFLDGNGTFDTTLSTNGFPSRGDFGNSFLKLSTTGTLTVADYFTMSNTVAESNADEDFGSGGAVVLLDVMDNGGNLHQLAVGAGKDTVIYVVDRNLMGGFNATTDNIYQEISGALAKGVFAKPAYFNGAIYFGAIGDSIKAFTISNAKLETTASSESAGTFQYPGTTPTISANGTQNPILWAVENSSPAVLHAYDATSLATEFYNTNQASNNRDHFGNGNKYIVPIVVNGKVFVGTPTGVAVFGLLP
ncbi:MAG: immunoglobulin domain-containing protein [Candidatus Sulfotelmatobacter sp.]